TATGLQTPVTYAAPPRPVCPVPTRSTNPSPPLASVPCAGAGIPGCGLTSSPPSILSTCLATSQSVNITPCLPERTIQVTRSPGLTMTSREEPLEESQCLTGASLASMVTFLVSVIT